MNTRADDLKQLRQEYKETRDPAIRKQIEEAGRRIKREGRKIDSMREALIRAHRNRNKEEIKDIHDFIKNRSDYDNR